MTFYQLGRRTALEKLAASPSTLIPDHVWDNILNNVEKEEVYQNIAQRGRAEVGNPKRYFNKWPIQQLTDMPHYGGVGEFNPEIMSHGLRKKFDALPTNQYGDILGRKPRYYHITGGQAQKVPAARLPQYNPDEVITRGRIPRGLTQRYQQEVMQHIRGPLHERLKQLGLVYPGRPGFEQELEQLRKGSTAPYSSNPSQALTTPMTPSAIDRANLMPSLRKPQPWWSRDLNLGKSLKGLGRGLRMFKPLRWLPT